MSNDTSTSYVKTVITKRYVVALAIIALLSTLALSMLHLVLKDTHSIAYVVNISGKQCMLSQHIALDAHRIHHRYQDKDVETANIIKRRLERQSDEMLRANTILSSGKLSPTEEVKLSSEMQELYFGSLNIAKRIEAYANTAKELVRAETAKDMERLATFFNTESDALLADLDKVVAQYQKEGEADLNKIQRTENIIYGVTLITLLLEVIFIFQPMARKLAELAREKELFMGDLRQQVELRTIHLERANERLNKLASHDPLTGLFNRLTFEMDMNLLIKHYKEHKAPFAVILFDIDWFKDVNDTYGHDIGDFVLSEFAQLLKDNFRQQDKIYRAGGEEFVALLSRISVEESMIIAQKIRHIVAEHAFKKGSTVLYKTVSAGVYHTDIHTGIKNYKNIYKLADIALYRAKDEGRNRVVLAQEVFHELRNTDEKEKCLFVFEDSAFNHVLDANGPIFEITGYKAEAFAHKDRDFRSMVYEADLDVLQESALAYSKTLRIVCADGKIKIVRLNVRQHNGTLIVEMYDAKSLAGEMRDAMSLYNFNAMLERTNDFIYFKDENHLFTAASKTLVGITTVASLGELIGATDYEVFGKKYADEYYKLEKAIFGGKVDVAQEYQPFVTKEGKKGWVDNRKYPIKDANGDIIGLFGIARVLSDDFKESVIPKELKEQWESL